MRLSGLTKLFSKITRDAIFNHIVAHRSFHIVTHRFIPKNYAKLCENFYVQLCDKKNILLDNYVVVLIIN
jgi:hypothetical protein